MSRLLRATSLIGKPVITLAGESPLEVKDVVFDTAGGGLLGFTLREHGFLGQPVEETLAFGDVHGLGPDAVVVADEGALRNGVDLSGEGGDVIADRVMTESGREIGEIVEVVLRTGPSAEVVGFEVETDPSLGRSNDHNAFIPLPDTVAISERIVVVPDSTVDYVRDDLSGFGSAVEDFRNNLSEGAA